MTAPARWAMSAALAPCSRPRGLLTLAVILSSSRSVAASRSARLRARSAATAGLRHTISRSPGNSGAAISANAFVKQRQGERGGDGQLGDLRRAQRAGEREPALAHV